jgi:hypothetical protein
MDIFVLFVLVGFDLLAENKISRGPLQRPARDRAISLTQPLLVFEL